MEIMWETHYKTEEIKKVRPSFHVSLAHKMQGLGEGKTSPQDLYLKATSYETLLQKTHQMRPLIAPSAASKRLCTV